MMYNDGEEVHEMTKNNPFSISFGTEPGELISREEQLSEIEESFLEDVPLSQAYIITGVRGTGKTVSLTKIRKVFEAKEDWIALEINSFGDSLNELVSKLYDNPMLHKLFIDAQINLSAFDIGASIKNTPPITHVSTALERMLKEVKKKNKKVLICMDEVSSTDNIKMFTSTFQILIRYDLPIYLVMTGLPQNIDTLQNEEILTFLYRAPKIVLNKLNLLDIAISYEDVLKVDKKKAIELAKLTNGYAFAYQVMGYLCFKNPDMELSKIIERYDSLLNERSYDKIWSELSRKEKMICKVIAKGNTKIKDIREGAKLNSGEMSTYRRRLNVKGIVDVSTYGMMSFVLPRFSEIINDWYI